jgi:hypothetical protein
MAGIEIIQTPQLEPTICGPVSDFKELTLASNAITLGWYGYAAGIITVLLFALARFYVAPRLVAYGRVNGWWV